MTRFVRLTASLFTTAALGFSSHLMAADAAIVQPGDMLAITGDSITEQRAYSVFMEDYLLMCKPVSNVRTMQMGWSGETSWGFYKNEIDSDVIRFKPTVATTCFGMNDGAYNSMNAGVADHYRSSTQSIIDKFKAAGVRSVIIGSPGCVGDELSKKPVKAEEYNRTLAALRDIDKDLAKRNDVIFADVFTPMMEINSKAKAKYGPKYQLNGPDGVHPAQNGHLVMAYAFLKAMGFSGDIGTLTIDMKAAKASTTEGHKLTGIKEDNGVMEAEFESTRYPFCFTGDPQSSNSTTGVIEFFPFNQELNRFNLVVKNALAEKVKITWGNSSKEFTAAELSKGINLAAEFMENPFSEQFEKVHQAVKKQQAFETPLLKTFVVNIPAYKSLVGDRDAAMFDTLAQSGADKDKALHDSAASLVTAVRHTIRIEAAK